MIWQPFQPFGIHCSTNAARCPEAWYILCNVVVLKNSYIHHMIFWTPIQWLITQKHYLMLRVSKGDPTSQNDRRLHVTADNSLATAFSSDCNRKVINNDSLTNFPRRSYSERSL